MAYRLPTAICLALTVPAAPSGGQEGRPAIGGTLTVVSELARHVEASDRLIIKLYHPGAGVELDAKYQIVPKFALPLAFHAAPSVDMSGQTKFDAYVIEIFTDKDDDVLRVAPGELVARTLEPVPLGTLDLRLEMDATRE